jgi:hypothetical protein
MVCDQFSRCFTKIAIAWIRPIAQPIPSLGWCPIGRELISLEATVVARPAQQLPRSQTVQRMPYGLCRFLLRGRLGQQDRLAGRSQPRPLAWIPQIRPVVCLATSQTLAQIGRQAQLTVGVAVCVIVELE